MPRTALFPRGSDLTTWALAITQRVERDFAFLRPKTGTTSLSATISNHISDINMTETAVVLMLPRTSNAAEMALDIWVSSKAAGEFTVQTRDGVSVKPEAVFDYVILPPPEA